jgi:hypothetical protein
MQTTEFTISFDGTAALAVQVPVETEAQKRAKELQEKFDGKLVDLDGLISDLIEQKHIDAAIAERGAVGDGSGQGGIIKHRRAKMTFIKLTFFEDTRPIYLNAGWIFSIEKESSIEFASRANPPTVVHMNVHVRGENIRYLVKESPDEIFELIKEAQRNSG